MFCCRVVGLLVLLVAGAFRCRCFVVGVVV